MIDRPALESRTVPRSRSLQELALPVVVGSVAMLAVAAVAIGAVQGGEAELVVVMLLLCAAGAVVASLVRWAGGSFGAPDAQVLPRHGGWFRYVPGRSGALGLLAIVGFIASAVLRGGLIIGAPALLGLVLGIAAAPVVFVFQRKRASRSLPPSIR